MAQNRKPACCCPTAPCEFFCGPLVTIPAPSGGGRRATAWIDVNSDGTLGNLRVIDGGTGYATAPTVSINTPPAGGTRATATAALTGTSVTGLTLTNPGAGYTVDNTPPAGFALTIASPTVTVGPIGLVRAGFPPGFTVANGGAQPANGIDGCMWYGQLTATFPANAMCPAVTALVGAAVYFSVGGWLIAVAYQVAPGVSYATACPPPIGFPTGATCQCVQSSSNWLAADPWAAVQPGTCASRPYSWSNTGAAPYPATCGTGCVNQYLFGLYGSSGTTNLQMLYTLTEVP